MTTKLPNGHKLHQIAMNYTNGHKLYQMAIHYTKWPKIIPNVHKQYKMAINYTKWPQTISNCLKNIPNDQKIYQHFPFQGPPKCTYPD
jgi:hypothetical protein